MNTKKIIIFMPSIEGGGVEKNLFIVSSFLGRIFSDVSLITSSKSYNNRFKNIEVINPLINFEKKRSRILKYISCLITLLYFIIFKKNVVVFSFQANLYCIIVCKLCGCKIITRSNSSPSGWSKNFLKKILYKKILSWADTIMVNSKEFQKEFKKEFNINAECIYNPLDKIEIVKKSFFRAKKIFASKKYLKIITVGRFVDQKDQITILKSLNLIKNKIDFKFVIIGKGILKEKLLNYIEKNNLKKKITVLNFKKNPYPYIKQADIFILSSKFEGLPNVLLEAICLKKLIISSNCPTGPREILSNGKGGFLFKTGNYKKLSKIILSLKSKRKHIQQKKIFAHKQLFRFDLNDNLNKYKNLIAKHL